jgi:hypothetical protein
MGHYPLFGIGIVCQYCMPENMPMVKFYAWWHSSESNDREIEIIDYVIVFNNYNFLYADSYGDTRSKILQYYRLVEKKCKRMVARFTNLMA